MPIPIAAVMLLDAILSVYFLALGIVESREEMRRIDALCINPECRIHRGGGHC